jgi:hypothetical protein
MPKAPRPDAVLTPAQIRLRATLAESSLLLLLAILLFNTNRFFTFIDDETNMLGPAAQPTGVFLSSLGALLRGHEHPPLYDLWLHFWLRMTGGAMDWLRVPSVVFFIAGLFCLSRAARLLAGAPGSTALLWLGVLWPYGFHFGRLAGWYSFAFLLIAALTWAYLRHAALLAENRDPAACRSAWIRVCLLGLALVYANYLGWALLFLLAVDDWIRHRARPDTMKRLLATAAVFIVAYVPLWPALWQELTVGVTVRQSWTHRLANAAYNVYVLFISESVAPWFWWLGIPAALAIAGCLLLALCGLRGPAQRFLIFASILVAAMALTGILYPRRLFMVAPWFLLAIAAAIGAIENRYWRSGMALCLGLIAAIGWYGFYARRFYATPRFFEPWETVAQDAADTVRSGGLVVGNNPSFFFYLTYALQLPESPSGFRFSGIVTETIKHPQIWQAEDWEEAGRPLRPNVLWVRGMPGPAQTGPMATASQWLDDHCAGHNDRYLARDPSYQAKQRFAPEIDQLLWRVEIHNYACQADPPAPAGQGNPSAP